MNTPHNVTPVAGLEGVNVEPLADSGFHCVAHLLIGLRRSSAVVIFRLSVVPGMTATSIPAHSATDASSVNSTPCFVGRECVSLADQREAKTLRVLRRPQSGAVGGAEDDVRLRRFSVSNDRQRGG